MEKIIRYELNRMGIVQRIGHVYRHENSSEIEFNKERQYLFKILERVVQWSIFRLQVT